ncbi:PLP-dependent aminotransferase family protein [Variovorax sp. LjRoot84]
MQGSPNRSRSAGGIVLNASISRDNEGSIQDQLYAHLQSMILSGQLSPGVRLPSTRLLSTELGVARNTVAAVFERLQAEGYVNCKSGSGTRVSDQLPDELLMARSLAVAPAPASILMLGVSQRALMAASHQGVAVTWLPAFTPGLPAVKEFPFSAWSKLAAQEWSVEGMGSMNSDAGGYWPLRQHIAEYVGSARGIKVDADQVIMVSGNREGTELAANVLMNSGDAAIVEEPGYPGTKSALAAAGVMLLPLPVDENGLVISEATGEHRKAKMLCIAPSHQYPLGVTTSLQRRVEILNWARDNGCWIVEDDYDSEFRYAGRPLPSILSIDPGANVIYIGTFSKTLLPSLRLGYVIVPKRVIQAFTKMKLAMTGPATMVSQRAVAQFIETGMFYRHVRLMSKLYSQRRAALVDAIASHLPFLRIPPQEPAGLFLITVFDETLGRIEDTEIAERASNAGIYVVPLSSLYITDNRRSGLVFGYGAIRPEDFDEPIRRLLSVIRGLLQTV